MAHDVFISYSSKDKPIADAVCANIEAEGIRCWIAPRDIAPGDDWPTAVTTAITKSRVMVLIFSSNSNSSDDVGRELMLAANSKLVIIPFKIENIEPEPGKQYYLARTHWLDAMNPPTQEQITILVRRVASILPATGIIPPIKTEPIPEKRIPEQPTPPPTRSAPAKRRGKLWPLWTVLALVVLGVIAWIVFSGMLNPFKAAGVPTRTFMDLSILTPPNSTVTPVDFSSMSGTWSGTAINNSTQQEMQVTISFLATCATDQVCAHFDNPTLKCSGDFAFVQMTAGMFEFKAMNTIGLCRVARDFLLPQSGDTLLYISQSGEFGETRGVLQKSSDTSLSADFNDPAFNGIFDSATWLMTENSSPWYSIGQSDGAMVFKTQFLLGSQLAKLNSLQHWYLGEFRYAEARLKLDRAITGENANVALTLSDLGIWWAGCGLQEGKPDPFIWCGQGENQTDYMSGSHYVEYGKWYTVRVEFDPQTAKFNTYIDNSPFYSWQPANIDEIKKKELQVAIGLWTDSNTSITGYVDDVRIGK
jgi:hypothetical protein